MTAVPEQRPVPAPPTPGVRPRVRRRLRTLQPVALAWLVVVWVALWGDLSAVHVVTGFAVALVVCLVFPLPRLGMRLRVRPLRAAWLATRFLVDVVVASAHVTWLTLQLRREPRNAVIEVDLTTTSDLVLTVVAQMVSLVPGSLVVEARRSTHTLFLHVLDARDQRGVDRMRADVLALERRVVAAIGTGLPAPAPAPREEETR
jgi:multicomponent Na+:H+ antiporter subunit E